MVDWVQIFASVLFLIFTFIGTVLNTFVYTVLILNFNKFSPHSHYLFAFCLLVCDLFEYFVQFTIHIPIPLMSLLVSRTYQQHPLFAYFTAIDHLARYAMLNLTFALCLNLLVGYCSSSKATQKTYCGTFSYLFLLCFWFFTGALVIISYLLNCKRLFDKEMFVLINNCDRSDPRIQLFYQFIFIYLIFVIVIEIFTIIFGHLKITKRQSKTKSNAPTTSDGGSKMYPSTLAATPITTTTNQRIPSRRPRISRNRQLLNQATLLCIVYIIDVSLFLYGPYVSPSLQANIYFQLLNIARNCIQILCYSARPLIFYFLDSEVNSKVKKLMRQISTRTSKD